MRAKKFVLLVSSVLLLSFNSFAAKKSADSPVVKLRKLGLHAAIKAARGAIRECRKRGYSVAVAIVEPSGLLQIVLRDRFAGPHTIETARRKAWTAVSFRRSTGELANMLSKGRIPTQVQHIHGALLVGGGYKIEADGHTLGGIGVSGAPPGKSETDSIDGACAKAGIASIREALDFAD